MAREAGGRAGELPAVGPDGEQPPGQVEAGHRDGAQGARGELGATASGTEHRGSDASGDGRLHGTGIVAIAAATLPFRVAGPHVVALAVWALTAAWLAVVSAGWTVRWVRHTELARGHAGNPVMAQFWERPRWR